MYVACIHGNFCRSLEIFDNYFLSILYNNQPSHKKTNEQLSMCGARKSLGKYFHLNGAKPKAINVISTKRYLLQSTNLI